MAGMSVEVKGLQEILRKLDPKYLFWDIAKQQLDALGQAGAMQARAAAGGFAVTGAMTASIDHSVNVIPKPLWVVVRVKARALSDGTLYPALLEASKIHGHRNWLLLAIRRAEQAMSGRIASAIVSGIEALWGK